MQLEIREITGFPGYGTSSDGRVWTRKNARWGLRDEWRPMAPRPTTHGYMMIGLCKGNKSHPRLIHRLIYECWVGSIPDGLEINHINAIRGDNNVSNLELVTRNGNMAHAGNLGRLAIAERNTATRLSRSLIKVIFNLRRAGLSQAKIASIVGCSRSNIGLILQGKTWKHMGKP